MNFQKTTLKRAMEVGEYAQSVFQNNDLKVIKEETGEKSGFPYIVQVNTYVYYVNGVSFMSKVDVDSNKVLETKKLPHFNPPLRKPLTDSEPKGW